MEFLRPYLSLVLGEKGYTIGEVASSATIPVRSWAIQSVLSFMATAITHDKSSISSYLLPFAFFVKFDPFDSTEVRLGKIAKKIVLI